MSPAPFRVLLFSAALLASAAGCEKTLTGRMEPALLVPPRVALVQVAESPRQWTGVAVSHAGRIFVNFPRWSNDVPTSVAELRPQPSAGFSLARPPLVPIDYPDPSFQRWTADGSVEPRLAFVCVQSVVVDDQDFLWVVDAGAPMMKEVIPGAAKVVKIDLASNQIVRVYPFEPPHILGNSYLNDIRIDTARQVAYLTDSGAGALLLLNLKDGSIRRRLADHSSTRSTAQVPVINGQPWRREGKTPDIHADGIALSPDGKYLYYHALTASNLYRIPTDLLLSDADPATLNRAVEPLGRTGPTDGMAYDRAGRIFLTQLELNAITRFTPGPSGNRVETIYQSPELAWPDTFAVGPDGSLYVTTSQIHLQPTPPAPYKLFKLIPTR
jgi:sugar lactone lactonase YvrE